MQPTIKRTCWPCEATGTLVYDACARRKIVLRSQQKHEAHEAAYEHIPAHSFHDVLESAAPSFSLYCTVPGSQAANDLPAGPDQRVSAQRA